MVTGLANTVAENLKSQPLALALVVVNVAFLAAGGWFLGKLGDTVRGRDAMILQLAKDCGRAP